ncbi:hypothetical protein [Reyranella sp.]|uniref:hypothetical protein n=1 Tax=Reyranella sp. TaxID=1929291 RepID=UPI003784B797
MRANLTPLVNLDFLDGYLFRLLQEISADQGPEASGFFNYYQSRLDRRVGGLVEYEGSLARYLLSGFKDRRIVHAGIGIGTFASVLACNGMKVTGVESLKSRVQSALRIRAALSGIWPEVDSRYEIVEGFYPDALAGRDCFGQDVILVFTNVGAGWDETALLSIIESMARFGEVFLDLRLFGSIREQESDRVALFDRIAATARWAERLPHVSLGSHLARFVFV